jgi:hypothetical protein
MGMLLGKKKVPAAATNAQIISGVRINSSTYGNILPVAIGPNRVPMSIIGEWDFLRTTHTTPGTKVGKGIGGGGTTPSTTSYTYSTAFQAALCLGPVDHLDAVYTSAGRIPAIFKTTDYTVPGGGGFIDVVDGGYRGDKGVGAHTAYSALATDFGADGSVPLSGTYNVPFVAGAVTAPGVYVISTPVAGTTRYAFDAADAGKTVTINYTSNLATVSLSAEIVIPGSATYNVPDPTNYVGNSYIFYAASGTQLFGPGDTLVAGHFTVDNSGNFSFNAADIGQTVIVHYQSKDPDSDAATVLNYSLIGGTAGQSPWSYLSGRHQDASLAHPNVALVQSSDLELGSGESMPQLTFETVSKKYMAGAGVPGANAADVILAILTDSVWGVNFNPALIGDWSNAKAFWGANSFFISLLQDTQTTAQAVIAQILDAGQGAFFWNNGKLCIAVYGDTSAAGNGYIYTPDTQPIVEFSVDDTVAGAGAEPIKVETEAEENIFNRVKIEFLNAANDYNTEVIMEDDPASVQLHGLHEEGQQAWHFIRSVTAAQWAANLRLKRMTNIRDKYTYTVTTRYRHLLAPMKLVTVTWDAMGWAQKPMRILKIDESHAGLALELEEFPYGIAKATLYPKQTPQAVNANPALINPGNTSIVALEIPDAMNGYAGRTVRVYANPVTPANWGGAEILTSNDNITYSNLGQITSPVVMGTLGSTLGVGTGDPDTQSVTVTVSNGLQILPASTADFAAKLSLLAIVDVAGTFEIVAYHNASLTGINVYTVDTFHRGLFGTTRASHVSGATVIELGEVFAEFQYPATSDGSTVYIKAASFNQMQGRLQDAGTLTPVSLVLSGAHIGFFNQATGQLYGLSQVPDDSSFKKTTPAQIQYISPTDGTIPASTPFNAQLSMLPGQEVVFTKAAETTTTLGLSWGTQTITFSDGSTVTLSGSSVSFTGLTINTTYFTYVYMTVASGVATLHFTQTTSPSPATAIQGSLDSRYYLGVVKDSTTASGTGGGGGTGSSCPHEDELVYVRRSDIEMILAAKDVRDGDELKGYSFATNADVYLTVYNIRHCESTLWFNVRGYLCSPCEQVYVDGAWYPAWKAPGTQRARGVPAQRIEISVHADSHEEHNYYLAGDVPLLIHNINLGS